MVLGRATVRATHTPPIGIQQPMRRKKSTLFGPHPDRITAETMTHTQAAAITHFAIVQLLTAMPLTG
jgi:hypothetical protein